MKSLQCASAPAARGILILLVLSLLHFPRVQCVGAEEGAPSPQCRFRRPGPEDAYHFQGNVTIGGRPAGEGFMLAVPVAREQSAGWYVIENVQIDANEASHLPGSMLHFLRAQLDAELHLLTLECETRVDGVLKDRAVVVKEGGTLTITSDGQSPRTAACDPRTTASLAALLLIARTAAGNGESIEVPFFRTSDLVVGEARVRCEAPEGARAARPEVRTALLDSGSEVVRADLEQPGNRILAIRRPQQGDLVLERDPAASVEGTRAFRPAATPGSASEAMEAFVYAVEVGDVAEASKLLDVDRVAESARARKYDELADRKGVLLWLQRRIAARRYTKMDLPLLWALARESVRKASVSKFGTRLWSDVAMEFRETTGGWRAVSVVSSLELLVDPDTPALDPKSAGCRLFLAMLLGDCALLDAVVDWSRWEGAGLPSGRGGPTGARRAFLQKYCTKPPAVERTWPELRSLVRHLFGKEVVMGSTADSAEFVYEGFGRVQLLQVSGVWWVAGIR